jgi:crotonobetainyl-CoA hydratase/dehydration protein DpgD
MSFIDYDIDGHVATITINRPEVRNALHPQAYFELSEALDRVEADDDVWVCVLTGAGDQAFSAGRDLKRLAEASRDETVRQFDEELLATSTRLTDRFAFAKPLIARLNGSAYGGGLELALACDIVVAASHARMGLPEAKRGLIAMAGGVHRLPRQIPLKTAMGHLLTGRDMSAQRAYELGLVNERSEERRVGKECRSRWSPYH